MNMKISGVVARYFHVCCDTFQFRVEPTLCRPYLYLCLQCGKNHFYSYPHTAATLCISSVNDVKTLFFRQSTCVREFDDSFIAPQFGFDGWQSYYKAASVNNRVPDIKIPLLALNAADDPFAPLCSKYYGGLKSTFELLDFFSFFFFISLLASIFVKTIYTNYPL